MQIPEYDTTMQILRDKRIELELSLFEVANEVNLSDSQLNRMELAQTNGSYRNVQRVWQVLQEHDTASQESAESLMVEDIEWAYKGETRADVVSKLTGNDFSQLPVMDEGEAIGFVTDFDLMEHPDPKTPVEDMMGMSAISVEPTDSRELVKAILEEGYPSVLVEDNDGYCGLITQFDLL
ncbi:CBS domain-containing protein [Halorarius halobius]|uniref:CBS domain-containing protein n=1 Tax=Halorarius halobius TaxID=2962671 RepID=UPI0020CD43CC|nr:CBS domain-containing protein [Halorarius halobius]